MKQQVTMIKFEKHYFFKAQRYRCLLLFSLLLICHNHMRVSADQRFNKRRYNAYSARKQTWISPRGGGAVDRYRDVLQIAQRKTKTMTKKRDTRRDSSSLKVSMFSPSHPFAISDLYDSATIPDSDYSQQEENQNQNQEHYIKEGTDDGREIRSSLPYILTRKENDANNKESKGNAPQPKSGYPVIYRYFGRSRARSIQSDSIPFIILGPSADHWKTVGKILASRGFNVMVCERSKEQKKRSQVGKWLAGKRSEQSDNLEEEDTEGEELTNAVLDALKWQKAVLVGCDKESVLAMNAALRLAPDRVAGLVLCGDLSDLDEHVKDNVRCALSPGAVEGDEDINVDDFLKDYLECPCSIIWDGDSGSWSTSHSEEFDSSFSKLGDGGNRSVIIGGGLAPHRRLPEQFAWTLTRFVENRVSPQIQAQDNEEKDLKAPIAREIQRGLMTALESRKPSVVWRNILPPGVMGALDEIFAPGSLLVTGRIIATAVIYLSITRVSLFQYHNIRDIRSFLLNTKNLQKIVTVPGLFLRNRIRNMNTTAQSSPTRRMPAIFHDEIDENEELQNEATSDPTEESQSEALVDPTQESFSESPSVPTEESHIKSPSEPTEKLEIGSPSDPTDESHTESSSDPTEELQIGSPAVPIEELQDDFPSGSNAIEDEAAEDDDDSLFENNVPSAEKDEKQEKDGDDFSFGRSNDDLGKRHLHKFLFFDQVVS